MIKSTEDRALTVITTDNYKDFSLEGQFMPVSGLRLRVAADGVVEFCMTDDDDCVVAEFSKEDVRRIVEFLK